MRDLCIVPSNICFMDLKQLDKFVKQINMARNCATPGCRGALTPVHVRSVGLGGAVTIGYTCNGCASKTALFETASQYELGGTNEVSIAVQVIAGCTHMTYYKTLSALKRSNGSAFNLP